MSIINVGNLSVGYQFILLGCYQNQNSFSKFGKFTRNVQFVDQCAETCNKKEFGVFAVMVSNVVFV